VRAPAPVRVRALAVVPVRALVERVPVGLQVAARVARGLALVRVALLVPGRVVADQGRLGRRAARLDPAWDLGPPALRQAAVPGPRAAMMEAMASPGRGRPRRPPRRRRPNRRGTRSWLGLRLSWLAVTSCRR
jgi:hypothetical protein